MQIVNIEIVAPMARWGCLESNFGQRPSLPAPERSHISGILAHILGVSATRGAKLFDVPTRAAATWDSITVDFQTAQPNVHSPRPPAGKRAQNLVWNIAVLSWRHYLVNYRCTMSVIVTESLAYRLAAAVERPGAVAFAGVRCCPLASVRVVDEWPDDSGAYRWDRDWPEINDRPGYLPTGLPEINYWRRGGNVKLVPQMWRLQTDPSGAGSR